MDKIAISWILEMRLILKFLVCSYFFLLRTVNFCMFIMFRVFLQQYKSLFTSLRYSTHENYAVQAHLTHSLIQLL